VLTYLAFGRYALALKVWYDGSKHHLPGYSDRVGEFHLGLLRVCRQIQHEAALLPYSLSIFAFRNALALRKFVLQLSTSQQNAIRTIQIGRDGYLPIRPKRFDIIKVTRLNQLGGLQTIPIEEDRGLAQIVRSWKAGITVRDMFGVSRDNADLWR
jgi:hypothetical protein